MSRSSPFQGRKRLGDSGEETAARFLEKRGYRVIERNYRTPVGELDIIALHRGTVVFVEVKARTSGSYGAPELAVHPAKQLKLIRAAQAYIIRKKIDNRACRFDVVTVRRQDGRDLLDIIPNAFDLGDRFS